MLAGNSLNTFLDLRCQKDFPKNILFYIITPIAGQKFVDNG